MPDQYRLTCSPDVREEYFKLWKTMYTALTVAHFLRPDIQRTLVKGSYLLMGFLQNDIIFSEEQFHGIAKTVLMFCDLPDRVLEPLKQDGIQTARMLNEYCVRSRI